jgi:hypothetical protein
MSPRTERTGKRGCPPFEFGVRVRATAREIDDVLRFMHDGLS